MDHNYGCPQSNRPFQVQARVFGILEYDVRFFPAFKQNPLFFKMLADLALIGRDGEAKMETEEGNDGELESPSQVGGPLGGLGLLECGVFHGRNIDFFNHWFVIYSSSPFHVRFASH